MIKTDNKQLKEILKDAQWIVIATNNGCYVEDKKTIETEEIEILEDERLKDEKSFEEIIDDLLDEAIEKIFGGDENESNNKKH